MAGLVLRKLPLPVQMRQTLPEQPLNSELSAL
jgi:hypothetical protein